MTKARRIDIELTNYRCFSSVPVKFTVEPGFLSFVGPNNAGKSTILRMIWELRGLFQMFSPRPGDWGCTVNTGVGLGTDSQRIFPRSVDPGPPTIQVSVPPDEGQINSLRATLNHQNQCRLEFFQDGEALTPASDQAFYFRQNGLMLQGAAELRSFRDLSWALATLADSLYVPAFRNSINVTQDLQYYDFEVGRRFIEKWKALKTGTDLGGNRVARQIEQTIGLIFGLDALQINAAEDGQTLQLFDGLSPFRLDEVGSGMSHFILALTHAAIRKPALVLIDEPELGLHPILQRRFLNEVASSAAFATLYATHSLGLARNANRAYTVTKSQNIHTVRPFTQGARLSVFTGEMSYAGYSDLGFKKILLVEGQTEIPVFQELLRKCGKDTEVVIFPLNGSNRINGKAETREQLSELLRITEDANQICAIIDNDNSADSANPEPARRDFKEVCSRIGIKCHLLEKGAVEHYWTQSALDKVKPGLAPIKAGEKLSGWVKSENWKFAAFMTDPELEATDLWRALNDFVA